MSRRCSSSCASLSPQSLLLPLPGPPVAHATRVSGSDRRHGVRRRWWPNPADESSPSPASTGIRFQPIAPKWRLPSPTRCRATAWARACWSASRTSRATRASEPLTPTCWARIVGCSTSFGTRGLRSRPRVDHGVCHVAISLSVTERFEEKAAARSRTAATASMKAFFEPRVVAVIGANRERGKIGSEILHNLVAAGFAGTHRARPPDCAETSKG